MEIQGKWISLLDYCHASGISMSTARRQIKSDKIKWKKINGKFFVEFETKAEESTEIRVLHESNEKLVKEICRLKDELADLKMLISIYENKMSGSHAQI